MVASARLLTLQRQGKAENTKALAERAIADRAKETQDAAGLEAQLRELRRAAKYARTFEEKDAIVAAMVPEGKPLAVVYPDQRIKLAMHPALTGAKTYSAAGSPGRRSGPDGSRIGRTRARTRAEARESSDASEGSTLRGERARSRATPRA